MFIAWSGKDLTQYLIQSKGSNGSCYYFYFYVYIPQPSNSTEDLSYALKSQTCYFCFPYSRRFYFSKYLQLLCWAKLSFPTLLMACLAMWLALNKWNMGGGRHTVHHHLCHDTSNILRRGWISSENYLEYSYK